MVQFSVRLALSRQRLQVDVLCESLLECGDVMSERLLELEVSSDTTACIVLAARLLLTMPIHPNQLVVLIVSAVVMVDLVGKDREIETEAQALRMRIV